MTQVLIRKARVQDVKRIHALLMDSSNAGLLIPRSFSDLYGRLRDFSVAHDKESGSIVGCCALSIVWEDIAEIRSLSVAPEHHRRGVGHKLVDACLSEAVALGIYRVFTLTYQTRFFARLEFEEVNKDVLPQKIWADCIHCPKFPDCDEIAMILDL